MEWFTEIADKHGYIVAFAMLMLLLLGKWVTAFLKKQLTDSANSTFTKENRAELSADILSVQKQIKKTQEQLQVMLNTYEADKKEYAENHILIKKMITQLEEIQHELKIEKVNIKDVEIRLEKLKLQVDRQN